MTQKNTPNELKRISIYIYIYHSILTYVPSCLVWSAFYTYLLELHSTLLTSCYTYLLQKQLFCCEAPRPPIIPQAVRTSVFRCFSLLLDLSRLKKKTKRLLGNQFAAPIARELLYICVYTNTRSLRFRDDLLVRASNLHNFAVHYVLLLLLWNSTSTHIACSALRTAGHEQCDL